MIAAGTCTTPKPARNANSAVAPVAPEATVVTYPNAMPMSARKARTNATREATVWKRIRYCAYAAIVTSTTAATNMIEASMPQSCKRRAYAPRRFQRRFFMSCSFLFSISESRSPQALSSLSQRIIASRDAMCAPRAFSS